MAEQSGVDLNILLDELAAWEAQLKPLDWSMIEGFDEGIQA